MFSPAHLDSISNFIPDVSVHARSRYLVESIRKFPRQDQLVQRMEAAGFRMCTYENMTFGVVTIHSGFKLCVRRLHIIWHPWISAVGLAGARQRLRPCTVPHENCDRPKAAVLMEVAVLANSKSGSLVIETASEHPAVRGRKGAVPLAIALKTCENTSNDRIQQAGGKIKEKS